MKYSYLLNFLQMQENLVRGLTDMKMNMFLTKTKKCRKTNIESSITFL